MKRCSPVIHTRSPPECCKDAARIVTARSFERHTRRDSQQQHRQKKRLRGMQATGPTSPALNPPVPEDAVATTKLCFELFFESRARQRSPQARCGRWRSRCAQQPRCRLLGGGGFAELSEGSTCLTSTPGLRAQTCKDPARRNPPRPPSARAFPVQSTSAAAREGHEAGAGTSPTSRGHSRLPENPSCEMRQESRESHRRSVRGTRRPGRALHGEPGS